MTFFTASFGTVLMRYYLMMAVIVASFTLGYPAFALLSFPIFISAISAISFKNKTHQTNIQTFSKDTEENQIVNTAA